MALLPPDGHDGQDPATTRRHRNWRRAVFLCSVLTGLALSYGWIKYATAAEVDTKISATVQPLVLSINRLNKKVDMQGQQLTTQGQQLTSTNKMLVAKVSTDLEKTILETQLLLCKGKTMPGVDYFRDRIRDLNNQYFDLTGRIFRIPRCEDL